MRVPSNATGVFSLQAGDLTPEDSVIDVPPVLLSTIELGTPHTFFSPSATRTPNGSFATDTTLFISNAAGLSSTICNLSRGVWRIRYAMTVGCNYVDAAGLFGTFTIADPAGTNLINLALVPAVTGAYSLDGVRMLYLREDVRLKINAPGNGVGQVYSMAVCVSGERVL